MRLKSLKLEIEWPLNVTLVELRSFLINHLGAFGEPVRWAITSVEPSVYKGSFRKLIIEAVVITQ